MKFNSQPLALALAAAMAVASASALAQQQSGSMSGSNTGTSDTGTSGSMGSTDTGSSSGTSSTSSGQMQKKEDLASETIKFDKGSSTLNKDQKDKLNKLVQNAQKKGPIDHLVVAVWSDKPFPSKEVSSTSQPMGSEQTAQTGQAGGSMSQSKDMLTAQDNELAQKRADAIKSYLKDQKVTADIKVHTMTNQADPFFARAFNASDEELRSEFARVGETPVTQQEFQIIKDDGKESNAVVIVSPHAVAQSSMTPSSPSVSPGTSGSQNSGTSTSPSSGY